MYLIVTTASGNIRRYAPVAQLDRALACGARGRTFESYRVYHVKEIGLVGLFYFIANVRAYICLKANASSYRSRPRPVAPRLVSKMSKLLFVHGASPNRIGCTKVKRGQHDLFLLWYLTGSVRTYDRNLLLANCWVVVRRSEKRKLVLARVPF